MMSKFLLLFCFTAVHVMGEGQENVSPGNSDALPNSPPLNVSNHLQVNIPASKKVSGEAASTFLGTSKNRTRPEQISSIQSSVSNSLITPLHATIVPPDASVISHANGSTVEQTSRRSTDQPETVKASESTAGVSVTAPGKWIVNGTDQVCLIVQMSVIFNVSYMSSNHTTSFKVFDLPTDNTTMASGNCGKTEQNLTLQWSSKNITDASMTMHFMKNESANSYSLHHLEMILPPANFPGVESNTSMVLVHNVSNFVVALSNSYRCLKQQTLYLMQNNSNQLSGYLSISGLQFQAFKVDNSTLFGLAKDCAFDTPDVVPIAVGCTLAGLVIIVLIAYLIGRRRSQARGYLSM